MKALDVPRVRFDGVTQRLRLLQERGQTDTGPDIEGDGASYDLDKRPFTSIPCRDSCVTDSLNQSVTLPHTHARTHPPFDHSNTKIGILKC